MVYKRHCDNCGEYYEGGGEYFCSPKCHGEDDKKKCGIVVKCTHCGKDKRITKSHFIRRGKFVGDHFCDNTCKTLFNKQKSTFVCDQCGESFERHPSTVIYDSAFCSYECHWASLRTCIKKQCSYCGAEISVKPCRLKEHNFCSLTCNNKYFSGGRHRNWKDGRSLKYKSVKWKRLRKATLLRDDYFCKICDTKYESKDLDTHHIISVRDFKTISDAHFLLNLVLLCKSCHGKVEQGTLDLYKHCETRWMEQLKEHYKQYLGATV